MPPTKSTLYSREYKLRFVEHKKVLEPNDLYSITAQEQIALMIAQHGSLTVVNLSVQLNCEALRRTREIENVIVNTVLPSKLSSVEL